MTFPSSSFYHATYVCWVLTGLGAPDQTESVNRMAQNLTLQVREIASVTKAVAHGDLSKTVDIGASGEIRELKMTVNSMVSGDFQLFHRITRVPALTDCAILVGRSTKTLRCRGHTSCARSRHGRTARRDRQRRRCAGRMEISCLVRQYNGDELDAASAVHCRRDEGRRRGRLVSKD